MNPAIAAAIPLLVVFIMTVVGTELRFADFRRMRRYPVLVPAIVVGQWLLLTVVAGAIGRLLDLPPAVTAGALLVAAAPVAALSGYYTQVAGGHLALAVTVAALSNALAVVATPLAATLGFRGFLQAGAAFDLPLAKVAQQTVFGLLLPLVAGMLIRRRAPDRIARWRGPLQAIGVVAVVVVLALVAVDQWPTLRAEFGTLLGAAALFTAAMLGAGWLVARLATPSSVDRRAIVWGFPARNVAVATLIATSAAGGAATTSFIAVLFATQVAVLFPLALWLRGRRDPQVPATTAR
jgi:BASS family bile acid:Na+ symporter